MVDCVIVKFIFSNALGSATSILISTTATKNRVLKKDLKKFSSAIARNANPKHSQLFTV